MITLATKQALLVNAALSNLGGFQKAVGETWGFVPYSFTDATRKKIRKLKKAVKEVAEDYEEGRKAIVSELSPINDDVSKESPEVIKGFTKRILALQAEMIEIDAETLDLSGELLRENKNPIPDDVLDNLDPILTQEAVKAKQGEALPGGE